MGTLTASSLSYDNAGSQKKVTGRIAFSSSYNNTGSDSTTGESLTAAALGLSRIARLNLQAEAGYAFQTLYDSIEPTSVRVKALLGGDTAHTHSFTGSTPYSQESITVTHAGTPGGNQIYVKFLENGLPYLACNMATDTVSKFLALTGSAGKFMIQHDASASTGGLPLYIDYDAAADAKLLVNNTSFGVDVNLVTSAGRVIVLKHDASASSNGVALNFDDGADERLEANVPNAANTTFSCSTNGWVITTFAGSNASATASAASEVANATNLSSTLAAVEFEAYGY